MKLFPKEYYWYNGLLGILVLVNGFLLFFAGDGAGELAPQLRGFVQPLLDVPFVENLHQSTDFGAAATVCIFVSALSSTLLAVSLALIVPAPEHPGLGEVKILVFFIALLLLADAAFFFGFMDPDEIEAAASKSGKLFRSLAQSKLQFTVAVATYFSWFHFPLLNQALFRMKPLLSRS